MFKRFFIVCVVLFLSACTSISGPSLTGDSDSVSLMRQGRFSYVWYVDNKVKEAVNGRFIWQDDKQGLSVNLFDALGSTVARLTDDYTSGAMLVDQQQRAFRGESLNALVYDLFGWTIPLNQLRFWVRGQSDPLSTDASYELNEQQRIQRLYLDAWRVDLERYDEFGPTKIFIYHEQGLERIEIRLVIPLKANE